MLAANLLSSLAAGFAPLALAATGGLATEYVGVLNIALEGYLMAGGFAYIAIGGAMGPLWGLLAAALIPLALALLQDAFTQKSRADAFVVGLAVNMLVPGLISVISSLMYGTKGVISIQGLAAGRVFESATALPFLGPLLFGHRYTDYLALAVLVVLSASLGWLPFGLRARAAGQNPDAVRIAGIDPGIIRLKAYALSGLACGLAGAALAATIGAWVPNLSSGRGWIALVSIYLGGKTLAGTLIAAAAFSLLHTLANLSQALVGIPAELLSSAPFFITAVAVILGSFVRKARGKT